jgi:hypothetical protein
MRNFALLLFAVLSSLVSWGCLPEAGKNNLVHLAGWGGGKPEEIVPLAADTGFDEIIVWSNDPAYLNMLVEWGNKFNLGIYSSLSLSHVDRFKKRFPGSEPPLQAMNEKETAALQRIKEDKSFGKSSYQYGGEPVGETEVLTSPLLCLHCPETLAYFKAEIGDILTAAPGLTGMAFDYFGYQNYRCCRCEQSAKLLAEWREKHPEITAEKAEEAFSLETLVEFNNQLAAYARSVKPDVKIATHVYPVFLPEPLYGNRLDVDYCGQTAAWFFEPFWSMGKITEYSRIITRDEKKYFPRGEGVAMIGVYVESKAHPVKNAERVRLELQAIAAGGADRVQVCSMNHVLKDEAVRQVFKEFFGGKGNK